ncbi:MAG: hypothetical protein JWP57_897, partial [Spirosoma sp.]|nr:hypothetical protein [Spirosoma sp.]
MKKHANKQPVDDLFARKLENMSLPPSPDGFARLQARMGHQPEVRTVFWRNPAIQQYMAIAACVLLCLFGWLYLSTGTSAPDKLAVAVNKSAKLPVPNDANEQANGLSGERVVTNTPVPPSNIAGQTNTKKTNLPLSRPDNVMANDQQLARLDRSVRKSKTESKSQPVVGLATQTEHGAEVATKASLAESTLEKQVAIAPSKPAPVAERVLIVTIGEPEALVAARQAVTSPTADKDIVAAASKPEAEARTTTIWQQVKRLKQGEVFARKDAGDDERGLIGRAYSGLK